MIERPATQSVRASMRQISSKSTWRYKTVYPAVSFGFLALWTAGLIAAVLAGSVPGGLLVVPPVLAVFYYLMLRWLVFPLMDEVWIDGDDLIVRNRGEEERFAITNIVDVEGSYMMSPEHIGIILEPPSRFGRWIRFAVPLRLFMFGTHPIAQELARALTLLRAHEPTFALTA